MPAKFPSEAEAALADFFLDDDDDYDDYVDEEPEEEERRVKPLTLDDLLPTKSATVAAAAAATKEQEEEDNDNDDDDDDEDEEEEAQDGGEETSPEAVAPAPPAPKKTNVLRRRLEIRRLCRRPPPAAPPLRRLFSGSSSASLRNKPALSRTTSAPPVSGHYESAPGIAAALAVAKRVDVGPDAYFSLTIERRPTAVVLTFRVERQHKEGTVEFLGIQPLVGASRQFTQRLEGTLRDEVFSSSSDDPRGLMRRARELVEAELERLDATNKAPEDDEEEAQKKPPALTKALETALARCGVRVETLTPYDLYLESSKLLYRDGTSPRVVVAPRYSRPCAICLATEGDAMLNLLACGHRCCADCWGAYVADRAATGCPSVECPSCPVALELDAVAVLAGDHVAKVAQWKREEATILGRARPCSTCGDVVLRVVAAAEGTSTTVPLAAVPCGRCGSVRCGACEGVHLGISCDAYRTFQSQGGGVFVNEEKSAVWLRRNTRPCPKCASHIEKNGGCLHVRCAKCRSVFCWACGGPAEGPGSCGSFRCYGTGVAGVGLSDRVGGAWVTHDDDDKLVTWVGLPGDLGTRDAMAVKARRRATTHEARARKTADDNEAAAHVALSLLYLRRWAELRGLCSTTDQRKVATTNLAPRAAALEAHLHALEKLHEEGDPRQLQKKKRLHLPVAAGPSVPAFDLLAAQEQQRHNGAAAVLPHVVDALDALARRAGHGAPLFEKRSRPRLRTKPRRPTIISHQVTNAIGQRGRAPWQRGLLPPLREADDLDEEMACRQRRQRRRRHGPSGITPD